jgi:hypothetical protein
MKEYKKNREIISSLIRKGGILKNLNEINRLLQENLILHKKGLK